MTRSIIMVFAGACSFGILSTFVKLAYREGYTAAEISFSQALMGMFVLWIAVFIRRKHQTDHPRQYAALKSWWPVLLTGVAIRLTTFTYYLSVHYIAASVAIVILMQFTWMGTILDWIFFKKKPQRIQLITILVILGGTVMAGGLADQELDKVPVSGILYALASALLYALYIVANSQTGNDLPPLKKSAIIMTGSAAGIFAVNVQQLVTNNHSNVHLLKWALFLAVFGTIIPPVLFARAIPKIGAGVSAIIMTAELPVAIICAHVILKEPITVSQGIGVTVMLLAITVMNLHKINVFKRVH